MQDSQNIVYLDDEIVPRLLRIIGEAKREVVLLSPYWDVWGHLRTAIERAIARGVRVSALVRLDGDRKGGNDGEESVAWLQQSGVNVKMLERLHAKIYMNEQTVMVSSMNLTETSVMNSSEVAVLLGDTQGADKVRMYVNERLLASAKELPKPSLVARVAKVVAEARAAYTAVSGHCIRCGTSIRLNREKPLCGECYDTWAEYENDEYEEDFCHSCGKPETTTYARPLCRACYEKAS